MFLTLTTGSFTEMQALQGYRLLKMIWPAESGKNLRKEDTLPPGQPRKREGNPERDRAVVKKTEAKRKPGNPDAGPDRILHERPASDTIPPGERCLIFLRPRGYQTLRPGGWEEVYNKSRQCRGYKEPLSPYRKRGASGNVFSRRYAYHSGMSDHAGCSQLL